MRRTEICSSRLSLVFILGLVPTVIFAESRAGWTGSVESSLTFIDSNRKSESIVVLGKARKSSAGRRWFAEGIYNFARQSGSGGAFETSTDLWSLGGRYEQDFGTKSFWYGSLRFDRDGVNGLNLRQVYGAGLGLTVYAQPESTWRLSAGASQVFEDYRTRSEEFFGFQAQSEYSRALTRRLLLEHTFLYVPSVSDFEDYFFASNLGMSYALNQSMTAGFRWIVSFDSTPAAGSLKQSRTYAFTLGYRF